jgi:sec-independent protein translocase protein TatC
MALVPFRDTRSNAARATTQSEPPTSLGELFSGVSLLERLDDFRKRIVRSLLAISVGMLVAFAFINPIVSFLLGPTRRALPAGSKMIYTQPGEAFSLYIWIAIIIGIIIAMPYILYQAWSLLSPIAPASVRRFAGPFIGMGTTGFIAGALFNHYVCFPYMMAFFGSFNTPDLIFRPRIEDVFDLYTKMLLGMGAVFQMPTVVFFLAKLGLVSARLLWSSFRYAILIIFIVAAVITPTGDMVTQTIFAAPMIVLYLLSILIAWVFGKARVVEAEETPDEPVS